MAKETFTGPVLVLGALAGGQSGSTPREYSDEIGPSTFWAGVSIPATGARSSKDQTGPGAVAAVYCASTIRTLNVALAAGNAALTTAANAVANTALPNLTTYALARAPVPVTTGGIATTGIALDKAIDAATFVAANATVTLQTAANTWRYRVGQWIALLGGGAAGLAQFSQITAIGSGTLTVSPAPVTAQASNAGGIALTNLFNPNAYGATSPSGVSAVASAGSARILIPECGSTRGVGITGVSSSPAGIQFLVKGTNSLSGVSSEIITHPGGAVTAWGKKGYDVFLSATPLQSSAFNYTAVTSDLICFPLSVMSADSIVGMSLNGTALVAANFTVIPADTTNPATQTTGDPRGGIQTTANGPGATPGTPAPFTGTVLQVDQRLNPLQVALSSCINPGPLAGVPGA